MLIRKAKIQDIETIMNILEVSVPVMNAAGNFQWDQTYPNKAVFEKDIFLGQLWVCKVDGAIAGFAAITTDQEPEYAEVGWDISETAIVTHRLAVHPKFRGYGVGTALLYKAEEQAKSMGILYLRIDTNTKNEATKKLFPKCGYEFSGEIGLHFRPGLRFLCYQKILQE
ncbi:MAG: GNAT family N-acetyltransferase [Ginsengibacter sp.]